MNETQMFKMFVGLTYASRQSHDPDLAGWAGDALDGLCPLLEGGISLDLYDGDTVPYDKAIYKWAVANKFEIEKGERIPNVIVEAYDAVHRNIERK